MASKDNQKIKPENIGYVAAELVADDDSNNSVLQLETPADDYNVNVAYSSDGQTVYVQQGQYVIPVGGHAVVLQDDQGDFEYIINNIVTDEELQDEGEVGQSVIYYASEFGDQSQVFEDGGDISETTDGVEESMVEEAIPLPKRIKLEQNYIDEESYRIENNFVQVQEEGGADKVTVEAESEHGPQQQSQYQYAILKNGKLHLQTLDFVDATAENQFSTVEDKDQHQQLQQQLAAFQQSISMDDVSLSSSSVDLDKITGRNLITGQTVTLDSYFDKLQRRLSSGDSADQCLSYMKKRRNSLSGEAKNCSVVESNFINKKIVVGKTSKGKNIFGKILSVQMTSGSEQERNENAKQILQKDCNKESVDTAPTIVGKPIALKTLARKSANPAPAPVAKSVPDEADWSDEVDETPQHSTYIEKDSVINERLDVEQPELLQPHIIIKKHLITRENFDYNIGNTLAGLMGLETVQRRLQNKNLVVKLVEKAYDHSADAFNKTVSFVYGHMELIQLEKEACEDQQWAFVLHSGNDALKTSDAGENSSEFPVSASGEEYSPTNNEENGSNDNPEEIKDVSLEMEEDVWVKYNETASLTIIVTVDKNGKKTTRVNLSPQQPESRCSVCNKEFKTPLQMRKHWNNVHLCEKSVKCDVCDKNFANQTILQRHQKIHTGERWFQCPKCSKSFNTGGSLKRHLTVHDPSLRPLECSVCAQRFTDESSLRKHLLIHTGIRAYACEVCNRAFVNQGDLNFHRRIHDPVKHFSCEVCGREFSRHSNLMRHAEIHRGVGALHRCEICGCSYSFVSSLTRHIVQKHIGQQQQQQ